MPNPQLYRGGTFNIPAHFGGYDPIDSLGQWGVYYYGTNPSSLIASTDGRATPPGPNGWMVTTPDNGDTLTVSIPVTAALGSYYAFFLVSDGGAPPDDATAPFDVVTAPLSAAFAQVNTLAATPRVTIPLSAAFAQVNTLAATPAPPAPTGHCHWEAGPACLALYAAGPGCVSAWAAGLAALPFGTPGAVFLGGIDDTVIGDGDDVHGPR